MSIVLKSLLFFVCRGGVKLLLFTYAVIIIASSHMYSGLHCVLTGARLLPTHDLIPFSGYQINCRGGLSSD